MKTDKCVICHRLIKNRSLKGKAETCSKSVLLDTLKKFDKSHPNMLGNNLIDVYKSISNKGD